MAKKTKTGCFESVYPVFIYGWWYTELIEIWTKRLCKENRVAYVCAMFFPFIAYLRWFLSPLSQTTPWRVKMSPGLGTQHLGLVRKRSGFVEDQGNHGHQGQNRQEHLKGSAWALGMFIIHCQSQGVGICIHHCGNGVASMENEQQRKSQKQTNWRL